MTAFADVSSAEDESAGQLRAELLPMRGGECLYHVGALPHGATPVTEGTRYIAVFFFRLGDRAKSARHRRLIDERHRR